MIDYIYGHDDAVRDFVAQLIPDCRERGLPRNSTTLGVAEVKDGTASLIAGIVYHDWSPEHGTIELSIGALPGTRWITRETLKRVYQYPFLHLGCQLVLARVAETNEPMLRILAALNYSFVRVPRGFGRDCDCILALLTVEDWAANKFNKRLMHHVAEQEQRHAA